jgi:amino acid adenylation domain-containing protein
MIDPLNKPEIPASNPEQQFRGEESLTDAQRHKLLVEWNNTTREYPQDKCIHRLFEEQVEREPDAIAVVFEEEHLTYKELNQQANCLAHHLKTLGVGPEVLVGICVERSLLMVVGLLGILKADGAYVPLDPAYPIERLAFMLEDSSVPVLLTQAQQLEKLPPHSARVVCLDSDWSEIAQKSDENPTSDVTPDNLVYAIYTSGSTGNPKGVLIEHRGLLNLVKWHQRTFAVSPLDRATQLAGPAFDASVWELWPNLTVGASIYIANEQIRVSPQLLRDWLVASAITISFLPTPLAESILLLDWPREVALRTMLTGGDKLHNYPLPSIPFELVNNYGPTENTVVTTSGSIPAQQQIDIAPPIGRPIANTQVYVLDAHLQPVSIGVPGELYIGGDGLARGYLNRPDLTREKFIPNPFSNQLGSRLYKTGDKVRYLPNGNIEFLGRVDNQVKIRGFRIELGEIEAALLQHPDVRDAVVIVREDTYGDKRLVAYIVGQSQISKAPVTQGDWYAEHISQLQTLYEKTYSQTPTHQNQNLNINQPLQGKVAQKLIPLLRNFLQEKLPDYMVPNAFMLLDTLPLTPNGKIDRHSLPVPDFTRPYLQENLVAPSTHIEKVLAQIWSEVLGVERVGIYDNFLELGGHSLLAIQIVSRLRDILKVELPVDSLFGSPTIAELQERIEAECDLLPFKQTPPIQRVSRNQNLPLSWNQEQLWFLAQLEPDTPVYNEPCTIRFPGAININALEKALNEIIKRHESLRTHFITVDGEPVQVIAPPATFNLTVVDLRQLSQEERSAEALRLATIDAKQLFDLTKGSLLRATLMQLADVDYRLFLTFHHIVIDGVSICSTFLPELAALYEAFSISKPLSLADLPVQYADFAVWQRQWLTQEILARQLNYWKQQLADLPVLQLPYDRSRPAIATFRGARQCLALSKDLTEALKALSQQEGVTLYITLLAAFKTLLYRYTGQEDIVVGTVSAGRNRPEISGLVGYFLNTLVLRTDLSLNPDFLQLLSRVREVTLWAYAHEDLPFQKLVETLQPERNLSQNPLFQVAFVLEPPMPSLNSGWTVSYLDIQTDTAKFDLTLELDSRPEGIVGRFVYNTDLFEAATISRMIEHFKTLLAGIVANPIARVLELPLLSEAERYQLLVEWNNTTKEYPQDKCIHQLFEEQVERSPDTIAVVFEGEQLTYRELNQRANQLAHYLKTLGVGPEVLVGICVERSLEMVVSLLSILKAGGAYLPLDPALPKESLAFRLIDAQVPILLTQKGLLKREEAQVQTVLYLDADWELIAQESSANPNSEVIPENLAYVLYTSGSTGQPKGVAIEHRQIVNYLHAILDKLQLPTGASFATVSTFAADLGNTAIFPALCTGGCLHIVSQELSTDPKALAEYFGHHPINCLKITPAHLASLLASNASDSILPRQCLVLGGEAASWDLIEKIQQYAPNCRILNHYGPTETTVGVLTYPVSNKPASYNSKTVPIGRPIANTRIYILDRYLQPVPMGVAGELYIGGDGVARGYLNRPDLTAEKFIPNFFSNESSLSLYKTSDLARYLPDGNIEFLGRLDNQVKIRGFRIELGEVEVAIAQYPGVRETAVIAREDVPGHKYLVAYIVPNHEGAITSSDLRGFLKAKLRDYMIPGAFVILSALPLTPNGKVDRRALPAPDFQPELQLSFVAPRTPIEEMLASIWADVLRIEIVGVHHNFFELGGHSLLATQVISRVRDTFAVELPLRSLFEAPTIAEFASIVENSLSNGQSQEVLPLLPIPRSESIPLSFAQARLWFLDQLQPNSAFYNIPVALRLSGQLNIAAIESSINEIIQRHEALRTNFKIVEGQPVAVIASTKNLKLLVVDLLHLRESEREIEAQRLATVEANRPFNLEREPLLRGMVLQLGETEYVLLLTMHHIISDGWSLGVFVKELTELYKAFCTGKPTSLPSLPVQYADFALWQRQWLQGEILEAQLDYWKQQLNDAPALLELPTDRPRSAVQTFRGGYYYASLSKELSAELTALSRRAGVTLFMTLLAAFVTLLYRLLGQDDIVVGTPVAGRNRREIEGLIGFFVNTLVLRTDLGDNPSFEDVLSRVREVALQAYTHQDLPFEQLVEALQPTRDLSYTPLFQVMFALDEKSVPSVELPELTVSSYAVEIGTVKFDLNLSMENTVDGLVGVWGYNVDLFDETTIARMTGHFQTLVEGIVANPQQRVSQLPILTERERHQLLVKWNNTQTEHPIDKCIHLLFEEQVELTPDAIAVVFEDKQLTYRELNQRANQLAHYLRTLGVEPEVLVGICVERSLEMVVSLLSILKAGGAYLPLDPALPKESLAFRLIDAQVPILLTQKGLLKREEAQVQTVLYLDADWELIAQESSANPNSEVIPENLAYVLYTSGSTGQPKGVAIEQRQILNYLHAILDKLQLPTGASFANVSTFAADLGNTAIFPALCTGGCLHIVSQELSTDPKALAEYFQRHPIDCLKITPTHLASLLASNASDSILPRQCLVLGGEAASWDLIEKIRQYAPNCRILNHYGPTETTVGVLTYPVSNKQASYNSKTVPIGHPIANTQVYILDRHLQPVPIGVPGELHIGGASLARGYLNRPDLTAEKFISNPFNDRTGTRLYKTGDKARYLPDGNIEFLGRLDNQVKIRGFRIELGEIEAVLTTHPEVREAVVIDREDTPGNKRLVAYIVAQEQSEILNQLRDFLKQKLPDYMVPSVFVFLDALPLTPNGKVDRRALPAPDSSPSDSRGFVPPRDTVEQQLQRIWSEVLQLSTIGVHDNFFELGGHSLLAVRLMAMIQQHFGKNLPLATLLASPTIEQLASCLRASADSFSWSPLVAIQSGGDKRPFFCVPGVGGNVIYLYELARHLGFDQPFYGFSAKGLDGESEPLIRVEDIAAYYIEAMQTLQPRGPYLLGGHSFGGVVAFEMAQQLLQMGHEVALVAIIDAIAPIVDNKPNCLGEEEATYLSDFASYIEYMFSLNLEVSKETLADLTTEEQLHYLKERLIRVNLLPPDAEITLVRGLVQVYMASLKAHRCYLPSGMLPTRIALFRAQDIDEKEGDIEELLQMLKEPTLGWKEMSGTVDVHRVPGNHMTMMAIPQVQVLAEQLQVGLEQAQRDFARL